MLFGFNTPNAGTITVEGENILGLTQSKIRGLGVSLVPEDRMLFGIAGTASIEENILSDRCADKRFNKGPLFNMKAIHEESDRLIQGIHRAVQIKKAAGRHALRRQHPEGRRRARVFKRPRPHSRRPADARH